MRASESLRCQTLKCSFARKHLLSTHPVLSTESSALSPFCRWGDRMAKVLRTCPGFLWRQAEELGIEPARPDSEARARDGSSALLTGSCQWSSPGLSPLGLSAGVRVYLGAVAPPCPSLSFLSSKSRVSLVAFAISVKCQADSRGT